MTRFLFVAPIAGLWLVIAVKFALFDPWWTGVTAVLVALAAFAFSALVRPIDWNEHLVLDGQRDHVPGSDSSR